MVDLLFNIQAYVSAFIFLLAAILWHTNGTEKSKNERVMTISYLLLLILLIRALTFIPLEISKTLEISILFLVMLGTMVLSIMDYFYYRSVRKADLMTIIEPTEDIPPKERVLPSYAEDEEEVMKWEFAREFADPYIREMEAKRRETEREIESKRRESQAELSKKEREVRKIEDNIRDKEEELKELEANIDKRYDALNPLKEKLKAETSKARKLQSMYKRKADHVEDLEDEAHDNLRVSRLARARAEAKDKKAAEDLTDLKTREKKVLEELSLREKKLFDFEDKLEDDYKSRLHDAIEAERRRLRGKHVRLDNFEIDVKNEMKMILAKQDEIKSQERSLQALMSTIENEKEKSRKEAEKAIKLKEEMEAKRAALLEERKNVSKDIRKAEELEDMKDDIEKAKRKLESQKESIKQRNDEILVMERKLEEDKERVEAEKSDFNDKIKDFSKREAKFEKERGELTQRLNEMDLLKTEINEKEKELKKEREKVRILQKTIRSETFK